MPYNDEDANTFFHTIFRASEYDSRTKLKRGVISRFGALRGEQLFFNEEGTKVVVTTNSSLPRPIFAISVDVEKRARLSATKLRRLGAGVGDVLEVKFVSDNKAEVKIYKQPLNYEQEYLSDTIKEPTTKKRTTSSTYPEGAVGRIEVVVFQRNPKARQQCIKHYGISCCVCGFNFEKHYGDIGKEFIHVHHLTPLASTVDIHDVDPIKDLRPVCPNCHAMLHSKKPPYTIEEMRNRLKISDGDVPPSS